MRAVVTYAAEDGASLEEVEIRPPGVGEVLVRVAASGVCGSDLHALHGRSPVVSFPAVLGHEGAGVLEAVGPGVEGLAPGDHVVIALYGPCLACVNCLSGRLMYCNGPARVSAIFGKLPDGSTRLHQGDRPLYPFVGSGTLAELAVVRATQIVKIDADLPLDVLCLAGCGVTTGLGAVFNIARVAPGDTVAVIGCGGVGLSVVQGARIAGAARIIAMDTNPTKLTLAASLGASDTARLGQATVPEVVSGLVPGGVDVAFEVVGVPALVADALAVTRPGGTAVMVGSPPAGSVIPVDGRLLFEERRLLGCTGGSNIPQRDIPRIVALYRSGALRLDQMVTQRLALEDYATAFAALEAGTVARSVVVMGGPARA